MSLSGERGTLSVTRFVQQSPRSSITRASIKKCSIATGGDGGFASSLMEENSLRR